MSDQIVESDALLFAAHVFVEAVVCDQQQGARVLLMVVDQSFLSV